MPVFRPHPLLNRKGQAGNHADDQRQDIGRNLGKIDDLDAANTARLITPPGQQSGRQLVQIFQFLDCRPTLEQKAEAPVFDLGLKAGDHAAQLAVKIALLLRICLCTRNHLTIQTGQFRFYSTKVKRNGAVHRKCREQVL